MNKKVLDGTYTTTTDYLSGYQYSSSNSSKGGELQFFPTSEGYVNANYESKKDGSRVFLGYRYVYNYTDHLGNIRLSYSDRNRDGSVLGYSEKDPYCNTTYPYPGYGCMYYFRSETLEENNYYPFGLKHKGYNDGFSQGSYKYKFGGKELQDELGLNVYDFGARMYMPEIGRWGVVDPLAEKYLAWSPYNYCINNPLLFIDPTGMTIEDPDNLVNNQKQMLMDTNATIKQYIKNGVMDAELGNKLISVNKRILGEISSLEKSDQIYNVSVVGTGDSGLSYDANGNKVMIKSEKNYGLLAHELKHAYQFEKREISIMYDNTTYGSLYDVSDETEAYNRERYLKSGRDYIEKSSTYVWQNSDVLALGNSMTPPLYQTLPAGPININYREGEALRQRTIEAGRLGVPVQEVYKGWKKDYQKGIGKR